MCFSASVSFVASAGLAAVGGVCVKRAKRRRIRALAFIPLLFSIQQFIEGLLWIVSSETYRRFLGYGFLLFAFLLWPTYVPFAVLRAETDPRRVRVLRVFLAFGILGTLYLFFVLLTQSLQVSTAIGHVAYDIRFPILQSTYGPWVYLAVVCGSMSFSSHSPVRWFGGLGFAFFLLSIWIYKTAFISVWCFFAAVLSAMLLPLF